MGLIAALPEIEKNKTSVFVMHEKSEKLIPLHKHNKGQLSYVEGGIAYITVNNQTYVVPARHYFWIPAGVSHILRLGLFATVLRSLYFYTYDDVTNPYYRQLGIYPANELLIQMITYTEIWDGKHVSKKDKNFEFLISLKNILPEFNNKSLSIILPVTDNEQIQKMIKYIEKNIGEKLSLKAVSTQFNISERSISRLFKTNLQISFLQYLKTLRMIKAIEMILKTPKPIGDIAFSVGYNSISSFSDTFHDFTNFRPSDFRRYN